MTDELDLAKNIFDLGIKINNINSAWYGWDKERVEELHEKYRDRPDEFNEETIEER